MSVLSGVDAKWEQSWDVHWGGGGGWWEPVPQTGEGPSSHPDSPSLLTLKENYHVPGIRLNSSNEGFLKHERKSKHKGNI